MPRQLPKDEPGHPKLSQRYNIGIVHHHIFKCAGSTIMSILERNYPSRVLYIEGEGPGDRISCGQAAVMTEAGDYDAISSHLLSLPPVGESLGKLHFTMLRDPFERILSAYHFLRAEGVIGHDVTIEAFCDRDFQAADFQSRHCSIPRTFHEPCGWEASDAVYRKIEAGEIIFGLVEFFDESMLLLEARARESGLRFDGAYPAIINTRPRDNSPVDHTALRERCVKQNQRDFSLYEFVRTKLIRSIERDLTLEDISTYLKRCEELRRSGCTVSLPSPSEWVYVSATIQRKPQ